MFPGLFCNEKNKGKKAKTERFLSEYGSGAVSDDAPWTWDLHSLLVQFSLDFSHGWEPWDEKDSLSSIIPNHGTRGAFSNSN